MEFEYGNNLLTIIKQKIHDKYEREYVNYFYNKLIKGNTSLVMYGMRRIGKTTLCFQLLNKLIVEEKYVVDEMMYIDIEFLLSLGYDENKIKQSIVEFIKNKHIKFAFFDEIQLLNKWDMFIKSIIDYFDELKIICSGSSSYNLKETESGVGRFDKFCIYPLLLREFCEIKKIDISSLSKKEVIDLYLNETPFFEMWNLENEDMKKRFLINILEKTIINDLNFSINRSYTPSYMKQIIREIALSETGELGFEKLQTILSIPKTTFYEYLNILQNINIINILERYNAKLTLSKRGPNKYYFSLPFFYKLYINNKNQFYQGKIYESLFLMHLNIVYNDEQLKNKIFYIKDKYEIDFYIPEHKIAYELKTSNIKFNELYLKLSQQNLITLTTLDIDELFNFIFNINLV